LKKTHRLSPAFDRGGLPIECRYGMIGRAAPRLSRFAAEI